MEIVLGSDGMIHKIYCDMDQVLVNFLGGAKQALGKEFNDPALGSDIEKWQALLAVSDFWLTLDWMPKATLLWERLRAHNPYVLTACPPDNLSPTCPAQKREWCRVNLGIGSSHVYTVQRQEKQDFASPDALLIDDHPRNVAEWRSRGGIAIQHWCVNDTINQLNQLGL